MAVRHLALASATAPSSPVDKQLWYDETADLLKRWDATAAAWKAVGTGTYLQSPSVATVITVGSGGDFATLAEALEEASRYRPLNGVGSEAVEVSLLTGFVLSEQVTVENIDLGHVVITSVDATVIIDRSALTATRIDGPAAFFGVNATMPVFDVLFDMDTSGVANDQNGFNLSNCRVAFRAGAGCQNATGRGLNAHHGTIVSGPESVWSGCSIGARIANGSTAYLRTMTATGCTSRAVSASASFVDIKNAVLTGATNRAVEATNGSVVIAANSDVTGYATTGIRSSGGSLVDATGASAQKAGSNTATDLVVVDGGILNVSTATGGVSQDAGKVTGAGIILDSAADEQYRTNDRIDLHPVGRNGATDGALGTFRTVVLPGTGSPQALTTAWQVPTDWTTANLVAVCAPETGASDGTHTARLVARPTTAGAMSTAIGEVPSASGATNHDVTIPATLGELFEVTLISGGAVTPGEFFGAWVQRDTATQTYVDGIHVLDFYLEKAS